LLALASAAIIGAVGVIDSHFITRRMPSLRAYLLIVALSTLIMSAAGLLAFPFPANLPWQPLWAAIGAAVIRTAAVITMLYVLQKEDVARVIPLMATAPVFVAMLAFIFLGERLSALQWGGVLLAVGGAVLISFKYNSGVSRFESRSFSLMLLSSLLFAGADVTSKYAMTYISFWNNASISFFVTAVIIILVCLRAPVVREILGIRPRWRTMLAASFNQVMAITAMVLAFSAIQQGPVSLVSSVMSTRPLFVFVYALALGYLWPGFLMAAPTDRKSLALKLTATLMIITAMAVISLA
jgi:transporter family protein